MVFYKYIYCNGFYALINNNNNKNTPTKIFVGSDFYLFIRKYIWKLEKLVQLHSYMLLQYLCVLSVYHY